MKKLIPFFFILFVIIFSCSKEKSSDEAKLLRISHDNAENSSLHKAYVYFKDLIDKDESLNFQVEIYPAAQLGSAVENFNSTQQGNVEMTAIATVLLSPSIPEFNVLDIFYLFSSLDQAHKSLDGKAGQRLLEVLQPLGLMGLGYMEVGMRSMSNNRNPIEKVEDLKGLKIRAADNPLQIAAWNSVGAAPIPMSWGEIFTSLQQGLLDGQESAIASMYTTRFFEAQKYISLTEHIYTNWMWVTNKKFWDSLTDKERNTLDKYAKETISYQREVAQEDTKNYLKLMLDAGLKVNEVSPDVKAEMKELLNKPNTSKVKELTGAELYEFVIAEVERLK